MEVLANSTVVIILRHLSVSSQHIYSLNLHNVICQLYLSKSGEKVSSESSLHSLTYDFLFIFQLIQLTILIFALKLNLVKVMDDFFIAKSQPLSSVKYNPDVLQTLPHV